MNKVSKPDRHIRVASYNIRKCVGLDMRRSPARILGILSGLNADVIALQEADKRLGARPAALPHAMIHAEGSLVPVDLGQGKDSLGWHGNAVLVRENMVVAERAQITLPGFEPRGAVLVELRHHQRPIRIVATHLGLMRRHRTAQLSALQADLAQRKAMPTLILGDFNEWSPDKGMEPLAKNYKIHAPGLSFHAARPVAALDRIAASDGLSLMAAGVKDDATALRASDHLPIWADFRLS